MNLRESLQIYLGLFRKRSGAYIGFTVLVIIGAVFSKLTPYWLGQIVDSLNQSFFTQAIEFLLILVSFRLIALIVQIVKDHWGGIAFLEAYREGKLRYLDALQRMDYSYHTNKSSGSLISVSKRGESALATLNIEVNDKALILAIEFIVSIVITSQIDLTVGAIILGTLLVTLVISAVLVKFNVRKRKIANKIEDAMTGVMVDNMVGFETVKIFAQERRELARLDRTFQPWKKAMKDYFWSFRYIDSLVVIAGSIGIFLAIYHSISLLQAGEITLGSFTIIAGYIIALAASAGDIIYKVRELAKTYTDLVAYFEVMKLQPAIKDPTNPRQLQTVAGEVEFNNVSFAYNNNREVLGNVSLKVSPGERIALVGKSGAGKTTLTKLLLRFYDVDSGEIKIDGVDIREMRLNDLRHLVGLVPQEAVLFNDTIAHNVGYAVDNPTTELIEDAVRQANLYEFVNQLPEKYQTIVGERGIKLSGGQKQRLAIARVILENPPIVIFDEATSQLDSENEQQIQEAFQKLTAGKTTLIIAHRLSTIMHADRIVVFDQGRIVEQGSHGDLIQAGGVYARLWALQTDGIID